MENQINVGDQNTQQVGQNPADQPVEIQEKPKVNYWTISTIVLLVILLGWSGFYVLNAGEQLKSQQATIEPPVKNTPTQQPATIEPIKTGNWQLKTVDKSNLDNFLDLYLVETNSGEETYLGKILPYVPEKEAVLTNDQQKVIFIQTTAGKPEDSYIPLDDKVVVYSIPEKKNINRITLREIKAAIPNLQIPRNAILNYLAISPSNTKVAMSYGYALEKDWGSDIIIFDISTGRIQALEEKGIVKSWKSETNLQYENIDTSVPVSGEQYPPIITREARIGF